MDGNKTTTQRSVPPEAAFVVPPPVPTRVGRFVNKFFVRKSIWTIIGVLVFVGANILIANWFTEPIRFETRAATHTVNISLRPGEMTITGPRDVQMWVVPDFGVAFIRVELQFNPALLKLAKNITPASGDLFTNVIEVTPAAEANATGSITYVVGLDPAKRDTPPDTAFQLFAATFTPVVTMENMTTTIEVPQSAIQVVGIDATAFAVTSNGTALTLHPVPATATSSPRPTSTQTPVPVVIRTPTPGVSVVPTSSPVACVPIQGAWVYGAWSNCTAQCGTGVQFRSATCTGSSCGGICPGQSLTRQECNTDPCSSTVTVYAAGTGARGTFPTMQLLIDNAVVAEWNNVRGNPYVRYFNRYVYKSTVPVSADRVKVRFTNDYRFRWEDRNLRVDKIVVDDKTYQTEDASTYASGARKKGTCVKGYVRTEWLACNGDFAFGR